MRWQVPSVQDRTERNASRVSSTRSSMLHGREWDGSAVGEKKGNSQAAYLNIPLSHESATAHSPLRCRHKRRDSLSIVMIRSLVRRVGPSRWARHAPPRAGPQTRRAALPCPHRMRMARSNDTGALTDSHTMPAVAENTLVASTLPRVLQSCELAPHATREPPTSLCSLAARSSRRWPSGPRHLTHACTCPLSPPSDARQPQAPSALLPRRPRTTRCA